MKLGKISVLGVGGWGTALSVLWAKKGHEVLLWGNNAARVDGLRKNRENATYLPGIRIPDQICLTSNLRECADADLIVFIIPSTALREVAHRLSKFNLKTGSVLLSCTKGIERGTGRRMSEILAEVFPQHAIAVLSGPNLAFEVSRELPTATVIACSKAQLAVELQNHLGTSRFRIYTGEELAGVELGGALKNIFAIAAGASDGLGLGDNSKAALVTRALAEMVRLGIRLGGDAHTFYGLSGTGDLMATCFSKHSRNRRVGEQLSQGRSVQEITSSMQMVAEGIPTAKSAHECARKLNVDTPIIDQVYAMLYKSRSPVQAMEELLGREQKTEGC